MPNGVGTKSYHATKGPSSPITKATGKVIEVTAVPDKVGQSRRNVGDGFVSVTQARVILAGSDLRCACSSSLTGLEPYLQSWRFRPVQLLEGLRPHHQRNDQVNVKRRQLVTNLNKPHDSANEIIAWLELLGFSST